MAEEAGIVLEDPLPDFVRPVGLARLGGNSRFARPYRIRSPHRIHIGDDVWFAPGANLSVVERMHGVDFDSELRVGDGCVINNDLHVACLGKIEIGRKVAVASRVYIGDAFRNYSNAEMVAEEMDYADPKSIRIHDNVILGIGSAVMPGVIIGERAIVGANAVVTRDIPPRSVAFGNPARVVRSWDERTGQWVTGPSARR